jgi:hypothetical protein
VFAIVSCAHTKTKKELEFRTVHSDFETAFNIAKQAGYRAFDDGELKADSKNGIIKIYRKSFWKGSTLIIVYINKFNNNFYKISVDSQIYNENVPEENRTEFEIKKYLSELELLINN